MTTLHWRYQEILKDGSKWTSDEVFKGEYRHAVQGVVGGHTSGQHRAAVEEGTGRVVYALDARGAATAAAVTAFSTIALAA